MTNKRYKAVNNSILAHAYGVTPKTFRSWIAPIKSKLASRGKKVLTPKQVAMIVEFLGEPEHIHMIQSK